MKSIIRINYDSNHYKPPTSLISLHFPKETQLQYQDRLKERIKELECLYAISGQISQNTDLNTAIPFICKTLEKAFQYPQLAIASIVLPTKKYGRSIKNKNHIEIRQEILFQGELIGQIAVNYANNELGVNSFLIEEKKLLKKVAQEISFLYERKERKEQEAVLNEIVRRQDRLTVLGEMTAGVAHELNTPLGNVIGFSEFILNSTKEKATKEDAMKIKQSALYAREIVKKLMLFSCDIPQKLSISKINSVIEEAIDLLSPTLKNKGIKVEFKPDINNPTGFIDKIQITQVIFNLLNNAIQASLHQGKISVHVSCLREVINIQVQDFGTGIPANIQDKIFEPFFTNKETGFGNGLGLSVVHGIIKKHKGRIQFSSEENVGTTFVVSIPQKT